MCGSSAADACVRREPGSPVSTFAVDGLRALEEAVLPFYEEHPPPVKHSDFRAFAEVVRSMRAKEHLTRLGFERLVRLAYGMNARSKQRSRDVDEILAGSSETGRGAPAFAWSADQAD